MLMSRFFQNSSGNLAIMSALAAVPMVGAIGVAVDMSRMINLSENLQASLDAAVLAGAAADKDKIDAAQKSYDKNIHTEKIDVVSLKFELEGKDKIKGLTEVTLPSGLSTVLGIQSQVVRLSATAIYGTGTGSPCVMALNPTASQAFLINGGAAPQCEVHVKSTANPAAIFNAGTSIVTSKTCIESTYIIDNGGSHPNLSTGCKTANDPYDAKIVEPASATCDFSNMNYSGNVTIGPGTYCGWTNFNAGANVTLLPGTYVLKSGGWNVDGGTWTGAGVTFYYADTSKIQFNSAVTANLTAPTSGTYKDILMAEKSGLSHSQFIFDDNKGFDMSGIIYLPSRELVFNSGTTTRSHKMNVVADTIILNDVKWKLTPYDSNNASNILTVRLVK